MQPDNVVAARSHLPPDLWTNQREETSGTAIPRTPAQKYRTVASQQVDVPGYWLPKTRIHAPAQARITAVDSGNCNLRVAAQVGIKWREVLDGM